MIQFTDTHAECSLDVAMALLEFASRDGTREHLASIFIDKGLCATDGHALLILMPADSAQCAGPTLRGRGWASDYVERAVKHARADKRSTVILPFDACRTGTTYPPVWRVMPDMVMRAREPIGVDPAFLARLKRACKACEVKYAKLAAATGSLDPIAFLMEGLNVFGRAVIMPARV